MTIYRNAGGKENEVVDDNLTSFYTEPRPDGVIDEDLSSFKGSGVMALALLGLIALVIGLWYYKK